MSTTTTNFDLIKPELTDAADITAFNSNWDKIDSELANINKPVTAASADGVAYTATVKNLTELYVGLIITIIPNRNSANVMPTLNVNGFGAMNIRVPLTTNTSAVVSPTSATWMVANKPLQLQYDGTQWKAVDMSRESANNIYGTLPVTSGGTGADNATDALTNLGAAKADHTHKYAGSATEGGVANSATKLDTARTIRTNLGSTSTASFDGTTNVTPGVTGTLPIANGGTGATTAENARTNLGILSMDEIINLYIWRKYTGNPLGYELKASASASVGIGGGTTISLYYSDKVTVVDGKDILVDEVKVSGSTVTDFDVIKGKFVSSLANELALIYYVSPNATFTIADGKLNISSAQQVTVVSSESLGYVASKTNNTYPTSGKHTDGYWYEYHKQLGE